MQWLLIVVTIVSNGRASKECTNIITVVEFLYEEEQNQEKLVHKRVMH